MKKKLTKVLTITLAVLCLISGMVIYSYAEEYTYNKWQYTAVTDTIGTSSVVFWELLLGNETDHFYFNSFCRGGPVEDFTTIMIMELRGASPDFGIEMNSDETGSRIHEHTITKKISEFGQTFIGVAEHYCTSKTNPSDKWQDIFSCSWDPYDGWEEYP